MKICFLFGGFNDGGGISRVVSIISNELSEKSYDITTLSFFNSRKENPYSLHSNIKEAYLFGGSISMTKSILKGSIKKLREYLLGNKIDIVVACGALFYPLAVLACKLTNVKCICWEHSNAYNNKDHAMQAQCRWIGAKFSDKVVTLTKSDMSYYMDKYHINSIIQIYNPIENRLFDSTNQYNSESKKIISVGRLSYQKNFQALVEIAKDILPTMPEWTWDIYGEGTMREEIQSKIHEYGIEKQLKLKGQIENLYDHYKHYSMIVMTSRYEGFPMTLLEASAKGLPLISFDIKTGPNEIIEESQNGYLIPAFDLQLMKERILKIIENPEKRQELSYNSYKKSESFKLDNIIIQWEKLFDEITSR